MYLKIIFLVTLTFNGCPTSSLTPYGHQQQLVQTNYQPIYSYPEQPAYQQKPIQLSTVHTSGYLPPAPPAPPPSSQSSVSVTVQQGQLVKQVPQLQQAQQQYVHNYQQQSQSQPQLQPQQQQLQQHYQQPQQHYQQPQQHYQQQSVPIRLSNNYEKAASAIDEQIQLQPQPRQKPPPIQLLSSYGPVASGDDQVHISPPTAKPLPPLQAGSVIQQLTRTQDYQQQQQNHNQQKFTNSISSQPSILIPASNITLYAANLLATALLDEPNQNLAGAVFNGNNYNQIMPAFIQVGPNTFRENNQLDNKTDLVIVKTKKTSYIIPMTISVTAGGPKIDKNRLNELYNQRDKLPIAYTVNQFLFFIRPANVNFLNKL